MIQKRIFAALLVAPLACAPLALAPTAQAQNGGTVITSTSKTLIPDPTQFNQGILFPYWILDKAYEGRVGRSGEVDYAALKGDPYLDAFVKGAALADTSKFPVLTLPPLETDKEQKPRITHMAELVFWINAYNANVLKAISDAYPINSVSEIKDFDTASTHTIAGKKYSFRELRQKIAKMDPRALFALTNGTKGGPMLAPAAYRLYGLNDLLEIAVSNFVRDPRNLELKRLENIVYLNDYIKDANAAFDPKGRDDRRQTGLRSILSRYTDTRSGRSFFNTTDYKIEFRPSDRALNMGTPNANPLGQKDPNSVSETNR